MLVTWQFCSHTSPLLKGMGTALVAVDDDGRSWVSEVVVVVVVGGDDHSDVMGDSGTLHHHVMQQHYVE